MTIAGQLVPRNQEVKAATAEDMEGHLAGVVVADHEIAVMFPHYYRPAVINKDKFNIIERKDLFGVDIKIGDVVAFQMFYGRNGAMRMAIGEVEKFTPMKVRVKYFEDSWDKKTKLEKDCLRRAEDLVVKP